METPEQFVEFADQATAGLADDPELRLDVRSELINHLEETARAFVVEGRAEDEAIEEALKAFGSPVDVVDELQTHNRARMHVRGLIRIAVRAVLVPAAVVTALITGGHLYTGVSETQKLFDTVTGLTGVSDSGSSMLAWMGNRVFSVDLQPKLSPEAEIIFNGDMTRDGKAAQQRAIWEMDQTNRVYCGNYFTHLLPEFQSHYSPEYKKKMKRSDIKFYEQEILKAAQLDPDNARYDYLLARLYIDRGAELEKVETKENGEGQNQYQLIVHDEALLDKGMKALVAGTTKPYCRTYSREMLKIRIQFLGTPKTFEQQVQHMYLATSILVPDLPNFMHLNRALPLYAAKLIETDRSMDARPLLDCWLPFAIHTQDDAWALLELLVFHAIVTRTAETVPSLYEQLGDPEAAEQLRRQAERLSAPVDQWRKEGKTISNDSENKILEQGSIFASALLPAIGGDELFLNLDFGPGRKLEQTLIERFAIGQTALLMLVVLSALAVVAVRWRFFSHGRAIPLLLLPRGRDMVRILFVGAIVPLAVYYVYSRWYPWSGRDYSLRIMGYKLACELSLLGITILYLMARQAKPVIQERCRSLRIAVPEGSRPRWHRAVPILLSIAWVLFLVPTRGLADGEVWAQLTLVFAGLALLFALVFGLVRWIRALRGGSGFALYEGTMSRTLLPLVATTILLVTIPAHIYLDQRETALIAMDNITGVPAEGGFTKLESAVTQKLHNEVQSVVESLGPIQ